MNMNFTDCLRLRRELNFEVQLKRFQENLEKLSSGLVENYQANVILESLEAEWYGFQQDSGGKG